MIYALSPVAALLIGVAILLTGQGLQSTLVPVRAGLEGPRSMTQLRGILYLPPGTGSVSGRFRKRLRHRHRKSADPKV